MHVSILQRKTLNEIFLELIPRGPSTLEGPNPGQCVGRVSVAQHGPALVVHLPLNMLKRERETWTSNTFRTNLEVDSLETLSLALLEEEKEEEKGFSQRFKGAKTCSGGFLLYRLFMPARTGPGPQYPSPAPEH